jgi:uncharacterized caspase-like protein
MAGSPGIRLTPDLPTEPRAALIIGTTMYRDPELSQLRAPAHDAEGLAEVLRDPGIGAFTVTEVIDQDERQVRRAIDMFLSGRGADDLVVVYLSCHGLLDRRGRLYFAATDTFKTQLGSTGILSTWLLDQLDDCRARRQVLILDCCFSGAFAHGSKGAADLDLERRLAGPGRGQAVLTASRAGEYSFEGQALPSAGVAGSVFTAGLVEGLRTGAADAGGDGYVSLDEAYDYAYTYVQSSRASQTPQRWLYGGEGDIVLAQTPRPDVPAADDEHYQRVVDEVDNLVVFLGARVHSDAREGPYRAGSAMLPDDIDLAEYLASKVKLKRARWDLAEAAQYVRMIRGESKMLSWARQVLAVDAEPAPVHKYLAHFPNRLKELGLESHYPMIITSQLDVALERAFLEAEEPFDVAIYMAPGTEYAGRFVHLPWGNTDPRPVLEPYEYTDFPIETDWGELTRTVIVRINGAIDDPALGYGWKRNFMITQDRLIDYFGGRRAEEVVPTQILEKLRQASCLFLDYTVSNWLHRAFLHWIWRGGLPSGSAYWAVESNPGMIEQEFWQSSGISLYRNRLTDYVKGFDKFLYDHREELT